MNIATMAVLLVIAVLAVIAVRTIRRKKLLHSCGGDCAHCAGNCKKT